MADLRATISRLEVDLMKVGSLIIQGDMIGICELTADGILRRASPKLRSFRSCAINTNPSSQKKHDLSKQPKTEQLKLRRSCSG
jgi:hypothetical protein